MNHRMQGMDTDHGREVSRQMDDHAGQVHGMVQGISSLLASVEWTGADAQRFSSDWSGSFAPQANGAVNSLQDNAAVLRQHADRQDAASQ